MEIRLEKIIPVENDWLVTLVYLSEGVAVLTANIRVPIATDEENIVRLARASFHAIVQTAAKSTEVWHIDDDVWVTLSKQKQISNPD